jgi:hypothetical protein
MLRHKEWESDECPRCHAPEDASHVWTCSDADASALFHSALDKLRTWMTKQQTHPEISTAIYSRLLSWQSGSEPAVLHSNLQGLAHLVSVQDSAGWQSFFEGTPAIGWADLQQQHYSFIGSRRLGRRWLSALLQLLWNTAWDLWEHRNGVLHNKDNNLLSLRTNQEIQEQWTLGARGLTDSAKPLFRHDHTSLLAAPLEVRQAWLLRIRNSRDQFVRNHNEGNSEYRHERRALRHWLTGHQVLH